MRKDGADRALTGESVLKISAFGGGSEIVVQKPLGGEVFAWVTALRGDRALTAVKGGVKMMLVDPSLWGDGRTVLRTEVEWQAVSGCLLKCVVSWVSSWNISTVRVIDAIPARAWALLKTPEILEENMRPRYEAFWSLEKAWMSRGA